MNLDTLRREYGRTDPGRWVIEPTPHANSQFRERVCSNISLLLPLWNGGDPIEAPYRDYDRARIYDGDRVNPNVVMLVSDTRYEGGMPDGIITTVVTESMMREYERS